MHLAAWTADGRLVVSRPVGPRTLSLAGGPGSDVFVPELGASSAFVRLAGQEATLFHHAPTGDEVRTTLKAGEPSLAHDLTWLLTQDALPEPTSTRGRSEHGTDESGNYGPLLSDLILWIARPMANVGELREALKEFLSLLVDGTPATSGMLVLAEGEGFSLVSSFGLSPKDSQKLWEKMPHTLTEEVLRSQARVLLPEELRRTASGDSTVFVRGVRSVAGFPVLAEGRLVAIFYLAFDNLLKHLSSELQQALEAAADILGLVIQRAQLREQLEAVKLKAASVGDASLPAGRLMVGHSDKLVDVYRLLTRLAPVDVATLVTGETGTGKELAAKELHRLSGRRSKPFVVVNAAALPESLIESELFGHKKGSFTGALTDRVGLVEQADGGTLFIDEIGELSLPMQAKLLRVLQERAVTRVGETMPRGVDFRLVTATHRNVEDMVKAGTFREDLYYRIAGAIIRVPSLRERSEDILTLANYFRQRFAERHGLPDKEWSSDALIALEASPWPGNVRELENTVSRAFVMAEGSVIRRRDLGFAEALDGAEIAATEESLLAARDSWMKTFLARALKRHNGHRAETAKALGIGERTLFRYLEQYGIRD